MPFSEKPKTSTIEKLSKEDLFAVNKLLILCGELYHNISNPSKPGPHTNPQKIDDLRQSLLLQALKVGERLHYPRGNPNERFENGHGKKGKTR